jgi:hypothetical protein
MSRTSTVRASPITQHQSRTRRLAWSPERQPLGQVPSHRRSDRGARPTCVPNVNRSGKPHHSSASCSARRDRSSRASTDRASPITQLSGPRGSSRTSTARASPITLAWIRATRSRQSPEHQPLGQVPSPERTLATLLLFEGSRTSTTRASLITGVRVLIGRLSIRSRTSTARANPIPLTLPIGRFAIQVKCPECQPLRQVPSTGKIFLEQRIAERSERQPIGQVPSPGIFCSVPRASPITGNQPGVVVASGRTERQPIGLVPSRVDDRFQPNRHLRPERQPIGLVPSHRPGAVHAELSWSRTSTARASPITWPAPRCGVRVRGPERQPIGQVPSPSCLALAGRPERQPIGLVPSLERAIAAQIPL